MVFCIAMNLFVMKQFMISVSYLNI
jgi:hypothetical protein